MYTLESRVRYSEADKNGQLSLSSTINYLQDCALFESESIGMGPRGLINLNRVWVLNSWQIEIENLPLYYEPIRVSTWPYDFKGMYGYRNFIITDDQGNILIKANSIWVLVDTTTGYPAKITEDVVSKYELGEKLTMEYAPRKIQVSHLGEEKESVTIKRYHLDTNNHVNNCWYVQMGMEHVPEDFVVKKVRVEYRKAAKLGDIVYPYVSNADNRYMVSLCDEGKIPYAVLSLE